MDFKSFPMFAEPSRMGWIDMPQRGNRESGSTLSFPRMLVLDVTYNSGKMNSEILLGQVLKGFDFQI